jgi:hypothetical protein
MATSEATKMSEVTKPVTNVERLRSFLDDETLPYVLLEAWEAGDIPGRQQRMLKALDQFFTPKPVENAPITAT